MNKIILIICISICQVVTLNAQSILNRSFKVSPIMANEADMQSDNLDYLPTMYHVMPDHAEVEDESMQEIIIEKTKQKLAILASLGSGSTVKETRASAIVLGKSWKANVGSGTPPDNTIAVNTKGDIVSMVNSNIIFYNDTGKVLFSSSMSTFFKTHLVPGQLTGTSITQCDPKVIFDCDSKRFIAFSMTCTGVSTTSRIMIAVSKEENPKNGWNTYVYASDPNNEGIWFDYPRLGVNGSDIFVTGNMFTNSDQFSDAVLYQIDKIACYNGDVSPATVRTDGLGKFAFSLTHANDGACPSASATVHYMISSNASGNNEGRLALYTITGKANDATFPSITSQYVTTALKYSPPGFASQPNTSSLLKTGGSRMHDAYLLNGTIHCAFQYDASSGFSGIHYSRLKNNGSTWSCTSKKISTNNNDYAYPTLANFSNDGISQNTLISFLASSNTEFPNMKAVVADDNFTFGTIKTIKAGTGYVEYISETIGGFEVSRWGDYIGCGKQYGSAVSTIFLSGMYGDVNNIDTKWSNNITKLTNGSEYPTGIKNQEIINTQASTIYPNPTSNSFWQMEINADKTQLVDIVLVDFAGKIIVRLLRTNLIKGDNIFKFNTATLANGTYFVNVLADNITIIAKPLIIQK